MYVDLMTVSKCAAKTKSGNEMSEQEFENAHAESIAAAMKNFDEKPKLGTYAHIQTFRSMLTEVNILLF
jgi:hypothetical protein